MSDDESQTQTVTRLEYPCPTDNRRQKLASATNIGRHGMKLYQLYHHVRISSIPLISFLLPPQPLSAPSVTPTPNSISASVASPQSVASRLRQLFSQDPINSN